jgi:hypothetical protein
MKKNRSRKSRDTVPLKERSTSKSNQIFFLMLQLLHDIQYASLLIKQNFKDRLVKVKILELIYTSL